MITFFEYDNGNRLLNSSIGPTTSYTSNNSIATKSNAGTFTYDQQIGHRVTSVDTEGTAYTPPYDTINFTSFNKVEKITSTLARNTFIGNFTYGPNRERTVMHVTKNGTTAYTKYYAGKLYEEKVVGGITTKYNYIYINDQLMGMFQDNDNGDDIVPGDELIGLNQANAADIGYYIHTDYLGSVVALSNSAGSIVEEYAYDAWGKRRYPDNWSWDDSRTAFICDRGFTGHEHLDEVGLINMNGRMYDPILGRMLSPDNNIQLPDFTQNLNRYSYCMNNPLMYTDPDGEWIQFAILGLFIAAKTYHDGVKAHDGELNPFKWNKPDTYVVGVSTNSDGSNATVFAGAGWGGESVPIVSYNNNAGLGGGLGDAYGNNSLYYPDYNYGAPEQNAYAAVENTRREYIDQWQEASNYYPNMNNAFDKQLVETYYHFKYMGMGKTFVQKLDIMLSYENNGTMYDFKSKPSSPFHSSNMGAYGNYRGMVMAPDDFGNYNYGVAASALELDRGFSIFIPGMFRNADRTWWNLPGGFDDIKDTRMIRYGYDHEW